MKIVQPLVFAAALTLPLIAAAGMPEPGAPERPDSCGPERYGPPGGPMGGPMAGHGFEGGPGPGPGMHGMGPPPFLHDLHLTEEQEDRVFAIVHAAEPALRDQFKAAHKAREALIELGHSAQYGDAAANTQAQALGKAETQLAVLRTRMEHDIFAVLTPEQKAQAAKGPHDGHDGHDEHDGRDGPGHRP